MILAARKVVKDYPQGEGMQRVLHQVDLEVGAGRFVAIMGPSGSGKSTLLHLLGGLDTPDAGEIELDGTALSSLTDDARTRLRRQQIGIVYQAFNLVPVLTVEENITLPAVIAGRPSVTYRGTLEDVLELVGLTEHRHKQPSQLSGGQQQRAAVGRALFMSPSVLLADEPTGNLDMASGAEVLSLFLAAQRAMNQTIIMVTHDPRTAGHAEEVHMLRDGAFHGRMDVAQRCRGDACLDPTHEDRTRAVLRWLEELDAARAAAPKLSRRNPLRAPGG